MAANDDSGTALLSMRGMTRAFGGVKAIEHADFELRAGEVHALLGENGAGKSTLMNILSGVLAPHTGEIRIDGEAVDLSSPAAAQAAGVAMIHQELDLVPGATVADNLFLGREVRNRLGLLNRGMMNRRTAAVLASIGVTFSPGREVGSLRVGEQQMVAIAKAISEDARILIMDEPTSALSDAEVESLLELVDRLRAGRVGIIYISHRMTEISRIADRATVMRDGRTVSTFDVATTSPDEIITKMIGRPIDQIFPDRAAPGTDAALEVNALTVSSRQTGRRADPKDITFTVARGEIVGLAGLLGAGRSELLQALFGQSAGGVRGRVLVAGRQHSMKSPRRSLALGIAYVPEDRRVEGLVMTGSVRENILLSTFAKLGRFGIRRAKTETKAVLGAIRDLRIKVSKPALVVSALSGGNQQKVVFARQLLREPTVLLLDEPTRGVDIGAKAEIYTLLAGLASDGMAIVMASSELPELIGLCDRILVMRDGRIVSEFARDEATSEGILAAASVVGSAEPVTDMPAIERDDSSKRKAV